MARALQFWSVAVLFGGAGFLLALRRTHPAAAAMLRLAGLLAAASGLAWFVIVFVVVADDPGGLIDIDAWSAFAGAPFGPPWLLRLALLAGGLGVAYRPAPPLCLALGASLVLDQAWLGHAATATGLAAPLQIASYWVHVFAGSAWVGALVMLCVIGGAERRVPPDGLRLFSSIGIAGVAALLLSGLANAWFRGLDPARMSANTYGLVLSAKVACFAAMVALALRHRARLSPDAPIPPTVWVETGLGLVVLGLAALLGVTPPP